MKRRAAKRDNARRRNRACSANNKRARRQSDVEHTVAAFIADATARVLAVLIVAARDGARAEVIAATAVIDEQRANHKRLCAVANLWFAGENGGAFFARVLVLATEILQCEKRNIPAARSYESGTLICAFSS